MNIAALTRHSGNKFMLVESIFVNACSCKPEVLPQRNWLVIFSQ